MMMSKTRLPANLPTHSPTHRQPRVKYPLLVMIGGEDQAVGNENTKEMLQVSPSVDKSYHELIGAAHEILNEPEDEEGGNRALRLVIDWLTERAPKDC